MAGRCVFIFDCFCFINEYLLDLCFGVAVRRGSVLLLYLVIGHLAAITSEMTRSSSVPRVNVEEQLTEDPLLVLQV